MSEYKPLYRFSLSNAKKYDEVELWRESHKENCVCAREIENCISDNYSDNCLDTDFAKNIISKFGFDRVMWVLSNTIQRNSKDERFSTDNKKWAKSIFIPNDSERWHFEVTSHQGLVNMFTDRVRKEWAQLGLYDRTHCTEEGDFENKIIVFKPSTLKDKYKTPEFQLFYATGGFGCDPIKMGQQVNGFFLKDGEFTHFRRQDFIGVLKEELIPEWAVENLKKYEEPDESPEIQMEGM